MVMSKQWRKCQESRQMVSWWLNLVGNGDGRVKRKCTTGDTLHQSHSQEHRPCVTHALFPLLVAITPWAASLAQWCANCSLLSALAHITTSTLASWWGTLGRGVGSQESCGYVWSEREQESEVNILTFVSMHSWHLMNLDSAPLAMVTCSSPQFLKP